MWLLDGQTVLKQFDIVPLPAQSTRPVNRGVFGEGQSLRPDYAAIPGRIRELAERSRY